MKKTNKTKSPLLYITIILVCLTLIFLASRLKKEPDTVVFISNFKPPPENFNLNEGTLIIDIQATEADIDVGQKPTKIQLFRSKKYDFLTIEYMYNEQIIKAGKPVLSSHQFDMLDGNLHHIAYTYKKDFKQNLYIDGQMVAESEFNPFVFDLTGMAVSQNEQNIPIEIDIKVKTENRMLTIEEIQALNS